jgi:membrane dipeptidase
MQRRKFIKVSALTAAGVSVLPTLGAEVLSLDANEKLRKKAAKIHEKILTLDSHCDTPLSILYQNVEMGVRSDSRKGGSKVDFVKMKEGGLDASFFAVFLGQGKRDEESNKKAKDKALKIFEAI